jgi:hypothetical protein
MSAIPPKADVVEPLGLVRLLPNADMNQVRRSLFICLLCHGTLSQLARDAEPACAHLVLQALKQLPPLPEHTSAQCF